MFRHSGKKAEDKSDGIPILKYGKGNNFYMFKTAVSTQATKEFGNLGKLINLEEYYVHVFDPPDRTNQGLMAVQLGAMRLEVIKGYAKSIEKMKENSPKTIWTDLGEDEHGEQRQSVTRWGFQGVE